MFSVMVGALMVGGPYSLLLLAAAVGRDRFLRRRNRTP